MKSKKDEETQARLHADIESHARHEDLAIREEVKLMAKQIVLKQPINLNAVEQALNIITQSYNRLTLYLHGKIDVQKEKEQGGEERKQAEVKNGKLSSEEATVCASIRLEEEKHKDKLPMGAILSCLGGGLLLICIMIPETAYMAFAFQEVAPNLSYAIIFAVGITVASYVIAHFGGQFVTKLQKRFLRILVGVSLACLITFTFFYASLKRSEYLLHTTGKENSPVYFFVFSMAFFIAEMLIIKQLILPNQHLFKDAILTLRAQFKLWKQRAKAKGLRTEITKNETDLQASLLYRHTDIKFAEHYELVINGMYIEAVEEFKKLILDVWDKPMPECFTKAITPLTFFAQNFKTGK